jgi:ABC-type lipoprotein release transport system permease subunit
VRSFDSRGDAPMMPVSSGRQAGLGEIILGARTMQELGVSIGDRVTVTGGLGSDDLEVVGTGVFSGVVDVPVLNIGAAVLSQSLADVSDPQNDGGADTVLVRAGSEQQLEDLIADVAKAEGMSDAEAAFWLTPQAPDELDRLAEVRSLPWVLAGFLGLLAVLATTALLVNSVRRQRRDLAVLRTQGLDAFGIHQIVIWQAVAVSVLGLVIGLPLGIIIGRLVWTAVASDIGVIVSTSIPWQALAATVLVVLLVDIGADTLRAE